MEKFKGGLNTGQGGISTLERDQGHPARTHKGKEGTANAEMSMRGKTRNV